MPGAEPSGSNSGTSGSQAQVVEFTSSDASWLEVVDGEGSILFTGELKGTRRFPLGQGLKVRSGRPDLVTVRVGQGPPRRLGRVEQVEWKPITAL
ncbi:MAG: DUF4115 domain-containing protein [Synechococcaceae cyanobacterium ELA445]